MVLSFFLVISSYYCRVSLSCQPDHSEFHTIFSFFRLCKKLRHLTSESILSSLFSHGTAHFCSLIPGFFCLCGNDKIRYLYRFLIFIHCHHKMPGLLSGACHPAVLYKYRFRLPWRFFLRKSHILLKPGYLPHKQRV